MNYEQEQMYTGIIDALVQVTSDENAAVASVTAATVDRVRHLQRMWINAIDAGMSVCKNDTERQVVVSYAQWAIRQEHPNIGMDAYQLVMDVLWEAESKHDVSW